MAPSGRPGTFTMLAGVLMSGQRDQDVQPGLHHRALDVGIAVSRPLVERFEEGPVREVLGETLGRRLELILGG